MAGTPLYDIKIKENDTIKSVHDKVAALDGLATLASTLASSGALSGAINGAISASNAQLATQIASKIDSDLQVKQALADFLLTYYGLSPITPIV
jgi:hypothetical protein